MTITFIWLMVILKIPIIALLYIVWWAIHQDTDTMDVPRSGSPMPLTPHSHPRRPLPRLPRRGPHGGARLPAPPRARSVVARARSLDA